MPVSQNKFLTCAVVSQHSSTGVFCRSALYRPFLHWPNLVGNLPGFLRRCLTFRDAYRMLRQYVVILIGRHYLTDACYSIYRSLDAIADLG